MILANLRDADRGNRQKMPKFVLTGFHEMNYIAARATLGKRPKSAPYTRLQESARNASGIFSKR